MQILLQDLRFALRQIFRNPCFSLTAVLSLTLGIGATVAVYSILYDAVLQSPGLTRESNALQMCGLPIAPVAAEHGELTGPQIRRVAAGPTSVEDVGCFRLLQSRLLPATMCPDNA